MRSIFLIITIGLASLGTTRGQSRGCADGSSYSSNDDFCQGPHTLCLYPDAGPSGACNGVVADGLTEEERQEILDAHNEKRALVASGGETRGLNGQSQPAGDIPPLEWDEELAEIAQRWVDQCNYGHDQCRNVDAYQVGQNAAYQYDEPLKNIVDMWYNEVDQFDPANVDNFQFSTDTGHYSQLVWGDTKKVGCGYIKYDDGEQGGQFLRQYVVCNYGPSGNFGGQPVYKTS